MFKNRGWYADIGMIQNTLEFHASYLRIHGIFHLVSTCPVLWCRYIYIVHLVEKFAYGMRLIDQF